MSEGRRTTDSQLSYKMSVHFRLSTVELNDLADAQERMTYWEDKTADSACNVSHFSHLKDDPDQKWQYEDAQSIWAIASERLVQVRSRFATMAAKMIADNQWKGEGCMGAIITRPLLELVCLIDGRRLPTRKPASWHPRGWTDSWVSETEHALVQRVIDLGFLKPIHGDAFWWLDKSEDLGRVFFWHETKGVMMANGILGFSRGEVPKDFLELKKTGVYREFVPAIKQD